MENEIQIDGNKLRSLFLIAALKGVETDDFTDASNLFRSISAMRRKNMVEEFCNVNEGELEILRLLNSENGRQREAGQYLMFDDYASRKLEKLSELHGAELVGQISGLAFYVGYCLFASIPDAGSVLAESAAIKENHEALRRGNVKSRENAKKRMQDRHEFIKRQLMENPGRDAYVIANHWWSSSKNTPSEGTILKEIRKFRREIIGNEVSQSRT